MKPATLATTLLTSGLLLTTHAQLIPFFTNDRDNSLGQQRPGSQRRPQAMDPNSNAPGIQLPPSNPSNHDNDNKDTGSVILSDVIGTQPQIQIFAGFTRDISSVSTRLDTGSQNTTVLAPLNRAISDLPRKPWEDPREYAAFGAEAYSGADGESRAHRNLRRFTEAHVVPASPWKEGEKVESLNGGDVWWEQKDGKTVVQPGDVEVEKVTSRVANGEVWVLKGVLNYAS
ncbi:hypothetical protein LTR37_011029 [Vermiconidia calcicola]|uniref:Uncharacterized protein n=1 Tax=Vermiconidia calcicola TaxID=1690605 RepID=A0ACC3N3X3_9PEZI|nr:hypothetical protein LTR37_011029 [Vermiconidia calcicola]